MRVKRIIEMLITVLGIVFVFWFAASYIDVIAHNLDEHPTYKIWNLFRILTENR